ncbi:MAG TPA: S9 family peptidase [Herpetosiphonaceae bacterium]
MTEFHPPIAKRIEHLTDVHGETIADPYFWLRDRDDPDTLAYIEAENAYTRQAMAPAAALEERIFAELRGRLKETDLSVPERIDGYWYYSRMEEGRQYPIYCRKQGGLEAPEQVLLDLNLLAEGQPFCRLGAYEPSPDHRLLAFSVDFTGSEEYTLRVKDLASGELLPDEVPGTYYSLEWSNDSQSLFYSVLDETMRPSALKRHALGAPPADDELVYFEPDERFHLHASKTRSRAFLLIHLGAIETSEVRYAPADQPGAAFQVIQPRRDGHDYGVEHHGDRFLITTNAGGATDFKLVEAPVASPGEEHWRELIPHRPGVLLDGVDAFERFIALHEREGGLQRLRFIAPDGGALGDVAFPEPVYSYRAHGNPEWTSAEIRFTYSSLVTPATVVDYNPFDGSWAVRKQEEIPSGYDPSLYESRRLTARAADGAEVPISLVYRAPLAPGGSPDGSRPLLLYGYGSYGVTIDPSFASKRLSLLDRGVIFAIAHIRGGAEMGRSWYLQGKLLHKKRTFEDFIASAEHLIAAGYTAPERLAIMGGSAGGLLMGAVLNARPELFKAAVAQVPFVDVVNTMLDPTLPLTVTEYDEWGNPADPEFFAYIRSYSPYDNVSAQAYPNLLVTAGLNDPRVSYWEPAKWVAKLRAAKTDANLLLLRTNTAAGHGGASGRYDALRETAADYAFILTMLGAAEA